MESQLIAKATRSLDFCVEELGNSGRAKLQLVAIVAVEKKDATGKTLQDEGRGPI